MLRCASIFKNISKFYNQRYRLFCQRGHDNSMIGSLPHMTPSNTNGVKEWVYNRQQEMAIILMEHEIKVFIYSPGTSSD